jgi:hypothetical protein
MADKEKQQNVVKDSQSEDNQDNQEKETFGEAGIKALRAERQKVKELEARLREIESQRTETSSNENDVSLREQLSFLTNGNAELQSKLRLQKEQYEAQLQEKEKQIENYEIKTNFEKTSLAAGLDPTYLGLYYSSVRPELTVVDGKVVHKTGVELTEWIETSKLNYPDLFRANNPGGVNARGGGATVNGKARVSRSDPSAFFKNLDDIASGRVQVDD